MKVTRSEVRCKTTVIEHLEFDEQQLTSYAGLIVFQKLFKRLNLQSRLRCCFRQSSGSSAYSLDVIVLLLIVHVLLGYRQFRSTRFYRDDPMVLRVLGLKTLPDTSTISRRLSSATDDDVKRLAQLQTSLVLDRLKSLQLNRLTLDFDGSVISTARHCEGAAIGWNRKKKGQRSYYPLMCTVAQTSQIVSVLHRSGNVHDSNGALEFLNQCTAQVRQIQPKMALEVRMDSAFFDQKIIQSLNETGVEFSISAPLNRYSSIKRTVENRARWRRVDRDTSYFEQPMKMDSWTIAEQRFLFVRQRRARQIKGPLQLDLFTPRDTTYEYKVIVTNKRVGAKHLIAFHDGRGSQEGLFAELKSQLSLNYIPSNNWNSNKVYLLSGVMTHNLTRELQMQHAEPLQRQPINRRALWTFKKLETLRRSVVQRAGRIIYPQGRLTLSMAWNQAFKERLEYYLYGTIKPA